MPFPRARPATAPVFLSVLFLLVGCTGTDSVSSPEPSADAPSVSRSKPGKGAVHPAMAAFFQCLKESGLPMEETSSGIPVVDSEKADPAKVKEAEAACEIHRPVHPVAPETLVEARELTVCMRENGIASFPDPDPETGRHDVEGLGLKESPEGYAAMKKCDRR